MHIRSVRLQDAPALVQVHAGSDGPWVDPVECPLWVNHRLLRPYYGDVAERDGRVVGHAEWIVGHEPEPSERHLYLGLLQVHPQYRGVGIGKALVEHGMKRARELTCRRIRTIPEEGSEGFYERCGLRPELRTVTCSLPPGKEALSTGWQRIPGVPARIVARYPMRIGWVHGCSTHMWEICNRWVRIAGDRVRHPCARRDDGRAYVQLRYLGTGNRAMALAWAPAEVDILELAAAATRLARALPVDNLTLTVLQQESRRIERRGTRIGEDAMWAVCLW